MAETPFFPESGASSGGAAPEDGTEGSADQPPADMSPETAAAAVNAAAEPPASVSAEPVPPEPVVASQSPGATADEPAPPTLITSPAESTPSEPVAPLPAPAEPSAPPPGVAATITVPPLEGGESGGGEWELLVERFTTWWNSGELSRQWQRIQGPLKGAAVLVAVLLALQLYATVVRTISGIPLVSGLLELTGLIAVLQFSATRLLRSSDRREALSQLQRRWLDFRGRS